MSDKTKYILAFSIIIVILFTIIILSLNRKENFNPTIELFEQTIKMKLYEETKIAVNSNVTIVFASLNNTIAVVDQLGNITAIAEGTTQIMVSSLDKKVTKYVQVIVEKVDVSLMVDKIDITSSNDNKLFVKLDDTLIIKINFNRILKEQVKILLNKEEQNYTFAKNQNFAVITTTIINNEPLVLEVFSEENKLIYTYKDFPKIDSVKPTCSLAKNNKTLVITGKDENGINGYNITTNINDEEFSNNLVKTIDASGIWYGIVKDNAGNIGTCEINVTKEIKASDIIIIGDSRMEGLCSYSWYKSDLGICVAKSAQGYKWFDNTAIAKVNAYLQSNHEYYITTNLGYNDLYNIEKYINRYQQLVNNEWQNYQTFIISVNPTSGGAASDNNQINSFNERLKVFADANKNVTYCDTNSKLKVEGFVANDGVHYNQASSKKIYQMIKDCIYDYYNK